jgi:hypothetical protein
MVIARVIGVVLAGATTSLAAAMLFRRLRQLVAGDVVPGTVEQVVAARAGGALVYHLFVDVDPPAERTLEVRSYRQIDVDTRVRVRAHPADSGFGLLAEWPQMAYELGTALLGLAAGLLIGYAAIFL